MRIDLSRVYRESCYSSLHLLLQVVPAGSIRASQLAKLVAHLSNSPDVSQHQRSALKLKGATQPAFHVHLPRRIESCWELRTRARPQSQGRARNGPEATLRSSTSHATGQVSHAGSTSARLHSDSKKVHGTAQPEILLGMSSSDMEDWWSLSPEELALMQADPNYHPQLKQKQGGASYGHSAVGVSDKTVDAWAGEITNKWRTLMAQQQKASGVAGHGTDPLQSTRGKADRMGVGEEGTLAPSATVGRQLWARLKLVATAHLEDQAKQKAKQALEIADAVAQEERVALQQYQNGEFIFRSSISVKPATDLPEDMMRRVRAATTGYCLWESHASMPNAPAGLVPKRRSSRAGRPSDRHKTRQKYPTPWYVPSDMWGTRLESKLKQKVLARTGDTDPDYLKATELETLDWAQGAEQQAAQMFKKYIRQSGTRVPHYLRSVKTPDGNEQALLDSHVNWSSRSISRSNTAKPRIESMFSNPRERLLGVYATQDGNKDHMAVVAAAMQEGKVGKLESRQTSTRATIRGILSGIK
ncbi:TPA: hypothetical protein ACH3X1_005501 [Trebouxia sp. C0004]